MRDLLFQSCSGHDWVGGKIYNLLLLKLNCLGVFFAVPIAISASLLSLQSKQSIIILSYSELYLLRFTYIFYQFVQQIKTFFLRFLLMLNKLTIEKFLLWMLSGVCLIFFYYVSLVFWFIPFFPVFNYIFPSLWYYHFDEVIFVYFLQSFFLNKSKSYFILFLLNFECQFCCTFSY